MSLALRGLTGQQVRVVLQDGSTLTGRLATVDDRFNVGIQGARDSALAGTPLETASADSIRIVRGGDVLAVFAAAAPSSSAPPKRYFDAAGRRWALIELRHGVFKKFPLPQRLLSAGPAQEEQQQRNQKLHVGDLVLCRVATMFQTGVVHGAKTCLGRFLLPFSFATTPHHHHRHSSGAMRIPHVSTDAFPWTGGEILSVLTSAAAGNGDSGVVTAPPPPLVAEVPLVTSEAEIRACGAPAFDRAALLELEALEQRLLLVCTEELVRWEIRSIRVVTATTDLARSFVQLFYEETDASTPLAAFKAHLTRVYAGSGLLRAGESLRLWMTSIVADMPHGITPGTKWPRHIAWPTVDRHRALARCATASKHVVLGHLIRCIAAYPEQFVVDGATSASVARIALSIGRADENAGTTTMHPSALVCAMLCGEWASALAAMSVSRSASRSPSPLKALADGVALRVAADALVPREIAAQNAFQSEMSRFLASATTATASDLVDFVTRVCSECTTIEQRAVPLVGETSEQQKQLVAPGANELAEVRRRALVTRADGGGRNALSAARADFHTVARVTGMWQTADPRADYNRIAGTLLADPSLGRDERLTLVGTINAPYTVKFRAPSALVSAAAADGGERDPEALRSSMRDASEQRHRVFCVALRHFHQQSARQGAPARGDSAAAFDALVRLRGFYRANFLRTELPADSLLEWAELCTLTAPSSGWCAALEATIPALRRSLGGRHSRDAAVCCEHERLAAFVVSTLRGRPQTQQLALTVEKLLSSAASTDATAALTEEEDDDDGVMPTISLADGDAAPSDAPSSDDADEFESALAAGSRVEELPVKAPAHPERRDEKHARRGAVATVAMIEEAAL